MASSDVQEQGPEKEALASANNNLAINVIRSLSNDKNVFFSPLSLSTAFAMLFCGTRGSAADEMKKVLGYEDDDLDIENIPSAFSQLLTALSKNPDSYTLSCANSLVTQHDFEVKEAYEILLKEYFQANVFKVDFVKENHEALNKINSWVKQKTNDMIPQLLDSLDPLTVIVLLNAIYFKGQWAHQFDKTDTHKRSFYNNGIKSQAKDIDMMFLKEHFKYTEDDTLKAIELPYIGDSVVMFVILPQSMDGLNDIIANLSCDQIKELHSRMRKREVEVYLPKFRLEYTKTLKETFQNLGMKMIFERGVDLSGMTDCMLLEVSEVVHKAVIEVNEEGSEAAAATAVMIQLRCLIINPTFIAEHPFIFTIYDTKRNIILFAGKINEL